MTPNFFERHNINLFAIAIGAICIVGMILGLE